LGVPPASGDRSQIIEKAALQKKMDRGLISRKKGGRRKKSVRVITGKKDQGEQGDVLFNKTMEKGNRWDVRLWKNMGKHFV